MPALTDLGDAHGFGRRSRTRAAAAQLAADGSKSSQLNNYMIRLIHLGVYF